MMSPRRRLAAHHNHFPQTAAGHQKNMVKKFFLRRLV
jgi:hypothetical protein